MRFFSLLNLTEMTYHMSHTSYVSHKSHSEHPELSEALCEEVLTRALDCGDASVQRPVLSALAAWMANIQLSPHWKVGCGV